VKTIAKLSNAKEGNRTEYTGNMENVPEDMHGRSLAPEIRRGDPLNHGEEEKEEDSKRGEVQGRLVQQFR
jgi:hypothetical protein